MLQHRQRVKDASAPKINDWFLMNLYIFVMQIHIDCVFVHFGYVYVHKQPSYSVDMDSSGVVKAANCSLVAFGSSYC